jgi:Flp pilus assembly protein TadD
MSHPPVVAARARALPALGFLLALLALAALALSTLHTPPRIITGLPEGPRVARARAALGNQLRVETGELRFQAALLGDEGKPDASRAISAQASLIAAVAHKPYDPRLHAALACLELAARRYSTAERHYRGALELAPTYGEARLGLGVTLALRAASEGDEGHARGLRLRAISQLAAVPVADPCYDTALYDRALLLLRVGHADEARRWAREYLTRDSASAWAVVLRRELDAAPQ